MYHKPHRAIFKIDFCCDVLRNNFSWLFSGRGYFTWCCSTITESHITFDKMISVKLCSAGYQQMM